MNNFVINIEPFITEEINLDPEVHAKVLQLAQEKNRTVDELIREILEYKLAETIDIRHLPMLAEGTIDRTYILHDYGKPIAFIKPLNLNA